MPRSHVWIRISMEISLRVERLPLLRWLPTTSHSTWEFMKGMYRKEVLFLQMVLWWCTAFLKGVELLSVFNQLLRIHVSCSWKINYVNKTTICSQLIVLSYICPAQETSAQIVPENNNMKIYFWILHIQFKHVKSLVHRLKVLNLSWH